MVSWNFWWLFWSVADAGLGIFKNDTDNKVVGSDAFLVSNPSDPWDFAPGLKRLRIMRAWHFGDSRDIALGIKKGPFDRKAAIDSMSGRNRRGTCEVREVNDQ